VTKPFFYNVISHEVRWVEPDEEVLRLTEDPQPDLPDWYSYVDTETQKPLFQNRHSGAITSDYPPTGHTIICVDSTGQFTYGGRVYTA
jgi:hypothetical protein